MEELDARDRSPGWKIPPWPPTPSPVRSGSGPPPRRRTPEAAEAMLAPVVRRPITGYLGDVVYGVDVAQSGSGLHGASESPGTDLRHGGELHRRPGGRAGSPLCPGPPHVYRGGVVSYWTQVKADVLGVPQALLEEYGAVSEPCARSMAENARRITGADIGLSVTGVAGPDADERGNPVGLVYVGLAAPEGTCCRKLDLGNRRRDRIQDLAANHAYDMLRRCLTGSAGGTDPGPAGIWNPWRKNFRKYPASGSLIWLARRNPEAAGLPVVSCGMGPSESHNLVGGLFAGLDGHNVHHRSLALVGGVVFHAPCGPPPPPSPGSCTCSDPCPWPPDP